MLLTKRKFLTGFMSSLGCPAIVKAQSLMPIYNGLILIGKGSHSVTGRTVSGRLIQEFIDPYTFTKTRWAKILGVEGYFAQPYTLPNDIKQCNERLEEDRSKGWWINGHPVKLSPDGYSGWDAWEAFKEDAAPTTFPS